MTDDVHLSPHFTLMESERSQTATRKGLNNEVPLMYIPFVKAVANIILEPIRAEFGPFSPTSWFRGLELNKAVGGSARSQHCKGQAVDIKLPGIGNFKLATWIMENLPYDQIILEYYDPAEPHAGWVHVSYLESGANRGQTLRFDGKSYKQGLV